MLLMVAFSSAFGNDIDRLDSKNGDLITISGYVRDAATGEELIGTTIMVPALQKGTYTNEYGFYSMDMPSGRHELIVRLPSYETITVL
jgi:hypothetical protein